MRVYLVRHAESELNAARVVQPPEAPLSARGRLQAERVGARLALAGVAGIVSSHLVRALETAQAIARHAQVPLHVDPDLEERNYGAIRGTPYAELRDDIFAADYVPPAGETWEAFHARVDRAWARVVASVDRTSPLVVVTHGLVCWSILSRHVTAAYEPCTAMPFANTALTVIDGPVPWRLAVVGCTAHLGHEQPGEGSGRA